MTLRDHRGEERCTRVSLDVKAFCKHFKSLKLDQDQNVFMFPYHIEEANFKPDQMQNPQAKPAQVCLDLRTEQMRRHVLENKNTSSLKKVYDMWNERPRIVTQELTREADFCHVVYRLEQHNQILHIALGSSKNTESNKSGATINR